MFECAGRVRIQSPRRGCGRDWSGRAPCMQQAFRGRMRARVVSRTDLLQNGWRGGFSWRTTPARLRGTPDRQQVLRPSTWKPHRLKNAQETAGAKSTVSNRRQEILHTTTFVQDLPPTLHRERRTANHRRAVRCYLPGVSNRHIYPPAADMRLTLSQHLLASHHWPSSSVAYM